MPRRPGAAHQTLGGKLGPRLAVVVNDAITHHLRQSAHHRAKIGAQAGVEFWKTVSAERDAHWGPLLEKLLAHDGHPEEFKQAMNFIRHGQGEGAAMAALSVVQAAGTQSAMAVLNAWMAPTIHYLMRAHANFLFDFQTAATLAAHGIISIDQAVSESAGGGYNAEHAEAMIEANAAYPDMTTGLELFRRGKIGRDEFLFWMKRGGIPSDVALQLLELWEIQLTPEELGLMVLKGIKTEGEVEAEAHRSGVTPERLKNLILAMGEPLGLQELQEAYRRGFINEHRLEHGVRQSRVRDEWMDVVLKLRYAPASVADAVRGVVQNHIPMDKGKSIAQQNGLEPGEFEWLYETAGNPPGVMQMIDLWRRGVLNEDQVKQGIRESRVKDKYVDHVVALKRVIPPERQVVSMITHGGLSEAEGAKLLHERGYDQSVVEGFVKSATSSQVVREKSLARAEVQELYYDLAIDEAEALRLLRLLGYTEHNATLVLRIVELKREKTLRQAAMSPIRTQYIDRHIDRTEASVALDQIGIPHQQRDFALALWTHDREAKRKMLTEAQISKANEIGLLSDPDAESRLEALGYTHTDARLLLDLQKHRTTPAP